MKTASWVCLAAIALSLASLRLTAAETARFRYVAAIYADAKGAGLNLPEGVACGANGQIVVGDTANGRLLRFTYQDKTVSGGSEIKIAQLSSPAAIQLNSKGEIYALDITQRRIVHLSREGEFKDVLAFDAVPSSTTVVPKAFTIDSADNIYVLDVFGERVLVLNAQAQFQRAVPLPDDTGFASGVAVDVAGNILVLDSIKKRMFSAPKDGTAFAPLGGDLSEVLTTLPTYVTATKGAIFVVEGNGSSIVSFGRDGAFLSRQLTMGWNEGALNHPGQICINDKDEVFVADRGNSRIQVFQLIR